MEILPGYTRYPNRSSRSGVVAFKFVRSGIQIQFVSGPSYEYSAGLSGADHVSDAPTRRTRSRPCDLHQSTPPAISETRLRLQRGLDPRATISVPMDGQGDAP
jgi:hypothetical protein